MENLDLLHKVINEKLPRQGPGDNASTKKAFSFLKEIPSNSYILDVGCGSGMQTLELARLVNGKILALDNHQPYLDELEKKAKASDFIKKITIVKQSMLDMNFEASSFDTIWSEGAAFIYGFEKAIEDWQFYLKEKGFLVFSELCWFKEDIPKVLYDYFMDAYPVMKNIEANIAMIKSKGLELIQHFQIPESSWWDNYYIPMEKNLQNLRKKYQNDDETLKLLEMFSIEIDMFRKYSDYYGYAFFIMKKK
ncbi:MAG: class I SAM-dependent methyltransferase [Candidatus Lokiarchaeota archaeon]|nr:class I SAM-dependent methyltransferase [Candidatus Lokiarchaeota archaeon]